MYVPTSQPKLQLKRSLETLCSSLDFLLSCIMIRAKSLRISYFSKLDEYCSIQGSRITAYHPAENGQLVRFNWTLLSMLRNLTTEAKLDWKHSLAMVVHSYNCTHSEATGYAPYSLLYGRNPQLPVDIMFGLTPSDQSTSHSEYANKCKRHIQWHQRRLRRSNIEQRSSVLLWQMEQNCSQGVEYWCGTSETEEDLESSGLIGRIKSTWWLRESTRIVRSSKYDLRQAQEGLEFCTGNCYCPETSLRFKEMSRRKRKWGRERQTQRRGRKTGETEGERHWQ